jgi:hypothetical protein
LNDELALKKELQIFTTSGVLLGRAALGSLRAGEIYLDPEDSSKTYRIIDLQPQSDRAWVQERSEISFEEFHFDEGHWFTGPDLGLGFLETGMIWGAQTKSRPIRLIQFEGGKMKGLLREPLKGDEASLFKGEPVLFVNGSQVLGGARVTKVK